jgi:hypothetical protein
LTIHNKQWHNFAASEARALGDIISESTGSIISECPGDFIGIRILNRWAAFTRFLDDGRVMVVRTENVICVDEVTESRKLG